MSAIESNVAVVPDSTSDGAHNIRTITVDVDNSNVTAGGQSEQQQVVTLADEDGNLLTPFSGGRLPVEDAELAMLLRAMLVRLDLLCAAVNPRYNPPDQLGIH